MKRTLVRSTSVRSIGYDRERKLLEVEFHNRHVYLYFGVPWTKFRELMNAESIGRYLNQLIRGRYEGHQLY